MKWSEQRLRARIREAFSIVNQGRLPASAKIEDQVLDLINEYTAAPKNRRDAVYLNGEKRILRTVRKLAASKRAKA
jgi:hypothetical protein